MDDVTSRFIKGFEIPRARRPRREILNIDRLSLNPLVVANGEVVQLEIRNTAGDEVTVEVVTERLIPSAEKFKMQEGETRLLLFTRKSPGVDFALFNIVLRGDGTASQQTAIFQ